jgi:hypothetical protein
MKGAPSGRIELLRTRGGWLVSAEQADGKAEDEPHRFDGSDENQRKKRRLKVSAEVAAGMGFLDERNQ